MPGGDEGGYFGEEGDMFVFLAGWILVMSPTSVATRTGGRAVVVIDPVQRELRIAVSQLAGYPTACISVTRRRKMVRLKGVWIAKPTSVLRG